jgi:hypothetical protein
MRGSSFGRDPPHSRRRREPARMVLSVRLLELENRWEGYPSYVEMSYPVQSPAGQVLVETQWAEARSLSIT